MNKFKKLKDVCLKMRDLAWDELEKIEGIKDMDEVDKECCIYSLFSHGASSQADLIKGIYDLNVNDLHNENEY